MGFDLVRMPPEISKGFTASLNFGTDSIRLADGAAEERVRTREMPELRWQASKGIFESGRLEEFDGFIRARGGALHGFRFVDLTNFSTNSTDRKGSPSALDQFLGYGDGATTEFTLRRTYPSTDDDLPQRLAVEDRFIPIVGETDDRLARCIGLPSGTVFDPLFALDAVLQSSGWRVNLRRRSVIFDTPPAVGARVTWGGYYDWPVRLGDDADANLESVYAAWSAGEVPNIPLVGIPFERFGPETDDPGGCEALAWSSGVPVLNKGEAKVWECTPGGSGLAVALQELSDLNYGGPHFILFNRSATYDFDVVDELTGTTILTLDATPSSASCGMFFCRGTGSSRAWFGVTLTA